MMNDQPLTVVVDGQSVPLAPNAPPPLVRAVLISLFTWRRANPDDKLTGNERMGWWGDSFAAKPNDRIGSRLWLLSRSTITMETIALAKEYATEALQWLVDDKLAARIDVVAERQGLSTVAVGVCLYRDDGSTLIDMRFTDFWRFLNV